MKVQVRRVLIQERGQGWEAFDLKYGTVRRYRTAANALRGVNWADRKMVRLGVSSITTIEWIPTTEVGRLVATALSQA